MKKIIILFVFALLLSFKKDSDKKYTVSLSVNDWQQKINVIEAAKNLIKNSDAPVKIALPAIDSLTKMQNEFISQLSPQLSDTITKKK